MNSDEDDVMFRFMILMACFSNNSYLDSLVPREARMRFSSVFASRPSFVRCSPRINNNTVNNNNSHRKI